MRRLNKMNRLNQIKQARKEMSFSEYCEETFGFFDPLTPAGQKDLLELYQPELQQIMKQYPGRDQEFYTQKIIQDMVVNEYLEFANHRGFEPIMDKTIPSGGVILNKKEDGKIPTSNKLIISIIKD